MCLDARIGTKLAEKWVLENGIFYIKKIPFHDNNMRSLFNHPVAGADHKFTSDISWQGVMKCEVS